MCFRNCGIEIFFDAAKVTKNGKKIPMELDGTPHRCPLSTWKKKSTGPGVEFSEKNGFITIGHFILEKKDFCNYCGIYMSSTPYYQKPCMITTDKFTPLSY